MNVPISGTVTVELTARSDHGSDPWTGCDQYRGLGLEQSARYGHACRRGRQRNRFDHARRFGRGQWRAQRRAVRAPNATDLNNYEASDPADFTVDGEYGDLPSPYNTTRADGGAAHLVSHTNNAFLGAAYDIDDDGVPDVNAGQSAATAGGDDGDVDGDDEDGVVFMTPLEPNSTAKISVTLGSPGALSAFIDFDNDGTLDEVEVTGITGPGTLPTGLTANDLVFDTLGVYELTIKVPTTTTTSAPIYSRFRFTENAGEGGASPDGNALSGEVEDYVLMSLGDRVWLDSNANGVQDSGETTGIQTVVVNLLDGNGDPVLDGAGVAITTTTSITGAYYFGGLPEGDYIVEIDPDNWADGNVFGLGGTYEGALGSPGAGGDNADNTDDNGSPDGLAVLTSPTGIRSGVIDLAIGAESDTDGDTSKNTNLTVDFGVYEPVELGDLIWFDANSNGVYDTGQSGGIADEFGVDGVTVEVYKPARTRRLLRPSAVQ